ncbi:leucine-rich repeat-containing protein 38-like [Diorhabda carinulata]|uniref:leucine-rich repeat-containing protein 38-like n=1 Tax=Diorhabda carinulata TaxID=1163345 RepID=UPI0025A16840|nr:leucine-rich repeat-containing protein 38-like [Diorhabda carinulata]
MSFKGNGIETLSPEAFNNLTNLHILDLSSNQIEFLPQDLFTKTNNLKKLDLSYNKLRYYPKIQYNYFEEAFANSVRYEDTCIDLSFNNLLFLNNILLKGIRYLKELNLNNNNIKGIGETAFNDLKWIESVNIEGNDLEELNDEVLKLLAMARSINVENNPWTNDFVCKYNIWCSNNDVINTMDVKCT